MLAQDRPKSHGMTAVFKDYGRRYPVLDIKSWNFKTSVFSRVSRAGFFVQFSPAVVSILHDLPLSRMLNSDMGMWHECQLWPHHDRSNAQRGNFSKWKRINFLKFSFIIPHCSIRWINWNQKLKLKTKTQNIFCWCNRKFDNFFYTLWIGGTF